MLVNRYDAVVVRVVMMVLDPVLRVGMRVRVSMTAFMRMIVVMRRGMVVVVVVFDMEMCRPAHVQVHRGQRLKWQDKRQHPGDGAAPVTQGC